MIESTILYFIMFLITSVLAELSAKIKTIAIPNKIFKTTLGVIVISIPAFMAAFRSNVGTDYSSYIRIFENIKIGELGRIEPGYVWLNQLVNLLGGNVHVVFFIAALINIFFVYLFLLNYKDQISVGLGMFIYLLFFYNSSLNIVRQGIAISIILYSFKYIDEKRPLIFHILVFIASFFHISALVVLPAYFFYNSLGDKSKVYRIVIYIIAFLTLFNYQEIVRIISMYILKNPYYLSYAESENIELGIGLIISTLPIIIIGLFFNKRFKNENNKFELYFFLLVIGFIFRLFPYFGASFLNRIADYFIVSTTWVIPFYYRVLTKRRDTYIIVQLLLIFCIFVWFYIYILTNSAETVPYNTIFN